MLKDKPMRVISNYIGEDRKTATVYQDLVSRKYVVHKNCEGFQNGIVLTFDNVDAAENEAEDWVLSK